jgi:recombinational DNA repair protein RecR
VEKVAAETAVTEHFLEDQAVAEVTEQDRDQETLVVIAHQKDLMVVDQLEHQFIITTEALEAVVLYKQVKEHLVLT